MFLIPCIITLYYIKNQLEATLEVLFISHCKITLHVSDAFCVHHQEYKQLQKQPLVHAMGREDIYPVRMSEVGCHCTMSQFDVYCENYTLPINRLCNRILKLNIITGEIDGTPDIEGLKHSGNYTKHMLRHSKLFNYLHIIY